MKPFFLAGLFNLVALLTCAQPGTLDASFGNGGKVLTNVDQTRNVTNSVLVQPDGKIVVVGYCTPVDYSGYFTLVRYNADGSIDNDFGLNGIVTTVINGDEDIAFSGALQADGKIIAAGYTWTGTDYDFAMVRFNPDGTRDLTFGTSGIVTTDFNGNNDEANQVLIQPDGHIFLAGHTGSGLLGADMALAKYHSDGTLDQLFGVDGFVTIPVSEFNLYDVARAITRQPDGKLVIAGFADAFDAVDASLISVLVVLRINDNGALDQTFGNLGVVKMAVGADAVGSSVVVSNQGKIIVLAETKAVKYGTTDFTILRFSESGMLDPTFGTNGMTTTAFDNSDDTGQALILQPDQKILAAGYTAKNNGSTVDFALARFNSDGILDNTFGNGGKVTVDFQGGFDFGAAIALQKDGKIIMAGSARVGNDYDFGLVRFENDVALPVKLIHFAATREEKQVHLAWQTSEESNSDYFEIQKSTDGVKWESVGHVGAAGTSVAAKGYQFIDTSPQPGQNYYRLKMVDQDETYALSAIKVVRFDSSIEKDEVAVYPNPVTNKLNLLLGKGQMPQRVQLYQLNGTLVFQSELHLSEIELPNLKAGPYCLTLQMTDGSVHSRTIVVDH